MKVTFFLDWSWPRISSQDYWEERCCHFQNSIWPWCTDQFHEEGRSRWTHHNNHWVWAEHTSS